jgi:two-component system sensor histidine kinase UhpB
MTAQVRVLIVEDVEEDAFLLASALRVDGKMPIWQRVDTEETLRQALEDAVWHIVISDYHMPAFSGIEALRIVHSIVPGLPFIIVSGVIGERTAVEVMRAGAHDFFVKGRIERLPLAVDRELRDAENRRRQASDASALESLQRQVNTFMQNAPIPIWIKDKHLRYLYANPAHCALVDCPLVDLVGQTDATLVPAETAGVIERQDRLAMTLQTTVRSQHEVQRPRKGEMTLDVIRFPLAAGPDLVLVAGVAIDITEQLSARSRLQEANLRLQRLSSQVIEVQERERKHLARDLHDDIGQTLTALKMTLDTLARDAALDGHNASLLDNGRQIVAGVIGQIRSLSLALRPPQLDDLGLGATIRFHIERQTALAGLGLSFAGDYDGERPHADIENTCFRIAQEVLTNILKHAHASHVWCTLSDNGTQLKLKIRDDGDGFDVESALRRAVRGDSSGLLNIRERAALVGGAVTVVSHPGEGTCIEIVLPRQPSNANLNAGRKEA